VMVTTVVLILQQQLLILLLLLVAVAVAASLFAPGYANDGSSSSTYAGTNTSIQSVGSNRIS
jgi:hypothetical protein